MYRREPSVRAMMIEINRRLYMDEQTGEPLPSFREVRKATAMLVVVGQHQQ
jgi:N-formylglutamate amidohydrolase